MQNNLRDRKQQELSGAEAGPEGVSQGHEEGFGSNRFIILSVVIVSLVYDYVKMIKLYSFNLCDYFVCKFTSIKLLKDSL